MEAKRAAHSFMKYATTVSDVTTFKYDFFSGMKLNGRASLLIKLNAIIYYKSLG